MIAMSTIYAANESSVSLNGKPLDGVRSIEYTRTQEYESVHALGAAERIGVVAGPMGVQGRLQVVSTAKGLDAIAPDFQLIAALVHGDAKLTVTFNHCYITGRSLALSTGGVAESVYEFAASSVGEE
jgi:hypothetical protein